MRLTTCSSYLDRSPKFSFEKSSAARFGADRTEAEVEAAAATAAAVAGEAEARGRPMVDDGRTEETEEDRDISEWK